MTGPRIVVAGVDASEHGAAAAHSALRAARSAGSELHAVHVVHVPTSLVTALAAAPAPVEEFAAAERSIVWERIAPILDGSGYPWTRVDLDGYPPDVLVRYATEVGADLLVVGSRGRGELAALFLGSTSHRVIHLAECDVLIARSGEDRQ